MLEEIHNVILNTYSKIWNEVKYFIEVIHEDKYLSTKMRSKLVCQLNRN